MEFWGFFGDRLRGLYIIHLIICYLYHCYCLLHFWRQRIKVTQICPENKVDVPESMSHFLLSQYISSITSFNESPIYFLLFYLAALFCTISYFPLPTFIHSGTEHLGALQSLNSCWLELLRSNNFVPFGASVGGRCYSLCRLLLMVYASAAPTNIKTGGFPLV